MRLAHLALDSDMDVVYEARPLWCVSLKDSNIIENNYCVYPPETLVLRWFDDTIRAWRNSGDQFSERDIPNNVQKEGVMTLPVEISYSSKRLDREKKLELILSSGSSVSI
jgi:hypothetical protein